MIVHVALKDKTEAQTFTFSRKWTVSGFFLYLSVGPFALLKVTFLVASAESAENDLPIGQPALQHLEIDSKTMLENNRAKLNKSGCSGVPRDTKIPASVGRTLIAKIRKVKNNEINTEKKRKSG